MTTSQIALRVAQINAEAEGREYTHGERQTIEGLLEAHKHAKAMEESLGSVPAALGAKHVDVDALGNYWAGADQADPGSKFIRSEGYKRVKNAESRGQSWSTGMVDVGGGGLSAKGTLLEGGGAPGTGTGGAWLGAPMVVPGVVDRLFQPLTVESLLQSGQATTNTVRYAVEGTATSAAAGVAEGGTKPESSLAYSTLDEPIKKIATTLTVSDELLEDAPAIQQFVNGRLTLFVSIESERQLIRGTSGGNEVQGLLTSRNVPVYTAGTADNKAVQLFKAMNSMRGSALVEPEWVCVHPTDWQIMRLLTDSSGQLFGGGPFLGSYGGGAQVSASGQVSGAQDTIWGKPVYVTTAVGGAGTALVGTRAGAQVWNRGGMGVEASNSHASYFTTNLVAIRAERRLGLTVYRSNAYLEVRFAAGPGG